MICSITKSKIHYASDLQLFVNLKDIIYAIPYEKHSLFNTQTFAYTVYISAKKHSSDLKRNHRMHNNKQSDITMQVLSPRHSSSKFRPIVHIRPILTNAKDIHPILYI